ncbi:MAG TPA: hypothetical protein VNZ57_08335, partial [Longimicrobiales bacterium]|nr:hypothetical protein [Longimicrobiales bacterium]
MAEWAGAVVALRGASEDAIASRLPTYLHPLAGRSLAWHVLTAVVALEPAPRQLRLVTGTPVDPAVFGGPPVEPIAVKRKEAWWSELSQSLGDGIDRVLVVDAAAPMLSRSLTALTAGPLDRVLRGQDGELLAIWASRELLDRIARDQRMEDAAREIATASPADP